MIYINIDIEPDRYSLKPQRLKDGENRLHTPGRQSLKTRHYNIENILMIDFLMVM